MIGDSPLIRTVGDLRKALKGIPGDKKISVRIPYQQRGFYNPSIESVFFNKNFKEYQIVTTEIL